MFGTGRRRRRRRSSGVSRRRASCRPRRRSASRSRAGRSRWPPTSPCDVTPGTTRILLRSRPSSDSLAVCSVEIHRKSGISFSTSDCSSALGSVSRTGPGGKQRDMHTGALDLAAQRLAERVDERLGCRIGRIVRNRRIACCRTGDQDPAGLALDHSGQHGEREVVHAKDIQRTWACSAAGSERRDRTERRGARVGAQDRDVADGQFVAQLAALGRVGEVDRPDLDGDAVRSVSRSASALSTSSRRAVTIRWCPRAASSVASASPMFCDAPVTTARASALGAGTGMPGLYRGRSWTIRGRPRKPRGGRRSCPGRCGTSARRA